jgi:hypothetical protein
MAVAIISVSHHSQQRSPADGLLYQTVVQFTDELNDDIARLL